MNKQSLRRGLNGVLLSTIIVLLVMDLFTDKSNAEMATYIAGMSIFVAVVWYVNKDEL